jgi:hypothetical protein
MPFPQLLTTARAGANPSNTEVKIDYLPGLASDEKNSEALGCKIFIYMAHF